MRITSAFRRILLAAMAILALASQSPAQPRLRGINCFGGAEMSCFFDVYATADGGYAMSGETRALNGNNLSDQLYVVKCNGAGEQTWAFSYGEVGEPDGGRSIIELDNGDFAVAGFLNSIGSVFRISSEGDLIWSHTYDSVFCSSLIELKQGDLILSGYCQEGENPWRAYLMRISADDGEVIWGQAYGNFYYSRFWGLRETDEAIVAAGHCLVRDGNGPFLGSVLTGKFEQDGGAPIWIQTYEPRHPPEFPTEEARSIASHPRGFILSGIRREGQGVHYKGLTRLIDHDGEEIWRHETALDEAGVFWPANCRLENNEIANVGQTGSGDGHPIIQWLSSDGEVRWQEVFDVRDFGDFAFGRTHIMSATRSQDNGVVFCGNIYSNDQQRGWDAFIWRTEPFALRPILTWTPADTLLDVLQDDTIRFTVIARDRLQGQLNHVWIWNERDTISTDTTVLVEFNELGFDTLRCTVTNGEGWASVRWIINVTNLYIVSVTPDTLSLTIRRGVSGLFSIDSVARNGDGALNYVWNLTDLTTMETVEVGDDSAAEIEFDFMGSYRVEGLVFRGEGENQDRDNAFWTVHVRGNILDFYPRDQEFQVAADSTVDFELIPFNPDSSDIYFRWRVNGELAGMEPAISLRFEGGSSDTLYRIHGIVIIEGIRDTLTWTVNVTPLGVELPIADPPRLAALLSVMPNPFNSTVTIRFAQSPHAIAGGVTIHDITGREVARLVYAKAVNAPWLTAKAGSVNDRALTPYESGTWDASSFPAGIYFARLESGAEVRTVKMALVR